MSARSLLVLALLLAGAGATLVGLGRGSPRPETEAEAEALVPAFDENGLRAIEIACAGASVTLRREGPVRWRITGPREGEGDPRRVLDLVLALKEARVRKVIVDEGARLADFGLSPGACTVRLLSGTADKPLTVRLGRSSPLGSERYATDDDARVVLTDGSLYDALARGADAFREKRLIPADPETITRIDLSRPDGRLVLAQIGRTWRVETPRPEPAFASACTGLARVIGSIEFSATDAAVAPAGARPDRRLRIAVTTQPGTSPVVAFVAAKGIDGKRLAWREGSLSAGWVEESALSELLRPAESFVGTRGAP